MKSGASDWPPQGNIPAETIEGEEKEICLVSTVQSMEPIVPLNRFSSFTHLQRVTAWILRFIDNCRHSGTKSSYLTVSELNVAEKYWIRLIQEVHFSSDIETLKTTHSLSGNSCLLSLHPFLDADGL